MHALPQPRRMEKIADHERGAVKLVAELIKVRALAHVIHLRGNREAFEFLFKRRLPRAARDLRLRQRFEKLFELRLELRVACFI